MVRWHMSLPGILLKLLVSLRIVSVLALSIFILMPNVITATSMEDEYREEKALSVPEDFFNLLYRDCSECFLFITEISTQTAFLMKFTKEPSYSLEEIKRFEIASGKQKGAKRSEWDLRTPVGYYEITQYRAPHTLDKKFGPGAYVLNYPNRLDRTENSTGSGIWIHGTDRVDFIDYDSEGCIRIKNDELPLLRNYLQAGLTPVIITEKINWVSIDSLKEQKEAFRQRYEEWLESWQSDNLESYLSFYSSCFFSPNLNMDYLRWMQYKQDIPSDRKPISVAIDDLKLIRRDDTIYLEGKQVYKAESFSDRGTKSFVWKLIDNDWFIVRENWTAN